MGQPTSTIARPARGGARSIFSQAVPPTWWSPIGAIMIILPSISSIRSSSCRMPTVSIARYSSTVKGRAFFITAACSPAAMMPAAARASHSSGVNGRIGGSSVAIAGLVLVAILVVVIAASGELPVLAGVGPVRWSMMIEYTC